MIQKTKPLTVDDPVYSSREYVCLWQFVLKYGSNIDNFFTDIPIPRYRLLSENEWFDIHTTLQIWKNYRTCLDDFNMTDAFDIGYEQVHNSSYGIVKSLVQFSSISFIMKMLPYFVKTVSKIDLTTPLEVDAESAVIGYTVLDGFRQFIDSAHVYHFMGTFAAFPTVHGMAPATVREVASIINILDKFSIDFAQFGLKIEEKNDGFYLDGRFSGRWMDVDKEPGLDPLVYRYLQGERCVLWEADVTAREKNGKHVTLARSGELYNCKMSVFSITWKNAPVKKRLKRSAYAARQFLTAFFTSRDELLKQTSQLHERSVDLEARIRERTRQIKEAQSRIVELEKRTVENRITGGFAHEMRNALAGAQLELASVMNHGNSGKSIMDLIREHTDMMAEPEGSPVPGNRCCNEAVEDREVQAATRIAALSQELQEIIESVSDGVHRGLALTAEIRNYSELHTFLPGKTPLDLVSVLNGYKKKFRTELQRNRIRYRVEAGCDSAFVKADESHIDSIFCNLIINAMDAVIEAGRSRMTVTVHVTISNSTVVVSIEDNGTGISNEHLNEIFEPFFTTKGKGGTGLGLGIVKRLVELYHGELSVESSPGKGTAITISLPQSNGDIPAYDRGVFNP